MNLQSKLAKYPKAKGEWCDHAPRTVNACDGCKGPIGKTDRVYAITTQVDFFRGNDEVEFVCVGCAKSMGQEVPPSKHERKLANVTREIELAKARIEKFGESSETGRKARKCIARCEQSLAKLAKELN